MVHYFAFLYMNYERNELNVHLLVVHSSLKIYMEKGKKPGLRLWLGDSFCLEIRGDLVANKTDNTQN